MEREGGERERVCMRLWNTANNSYGIERLKLVWQANTAKASAAALAFLGPSAEAAEVFGCANIPEVFSDMNKDPFCKAYKGISLFITKT